VNDKLSVMWMENFAAYIEALSKYLMGELRKTIKSSVRNVVCRTKILNRYLVNMKKNRETLNSGVAPFKLHEFNHTSPQKTKIDIKS
jgi:hypothetical protein